MTATTVLSSFSVLKDHVKLKVVQDATTIDNIVFRLHYRATFALLLIGSLLVCSKQFFGDHIKCMTDNTNDKKVSAVINSFCFFSSTFTITKYMNASVLNRDHIPHPGVGPYTGAEETVHHAYYQWVPFVLFFQAMVFYVPHYLWRGAEGGRLKRLVSGLHMAALSLQDEKIEVSNDVSIPSKADHKKKIQLIRNYFVTNLRVNRTWAYYLGICETLNFLNVILQIYLTNAFLGGAFLDLGMRVIEYNDWTSRVSPLDMVFPKVTKCIFHKYGSSGGVEKWDALCVMALNIVNEKIYLFLWFWFIILAIISGVAVVWRLATMFVYSRSDRFNRVLFSMACPGKSEPWYALQMVRDYHFGDWLFLYYIAKNLDNYAFTELLMQLEEEKASRCTDHYNQTLSMLNDDEKLFKKV
ncbi:innexin inx7 [Diachasma alloeum]|uniref:innexin inx7 n=1 Tax=Diachasma alloeum TaxID=454923 RepID=UPI0007384184|nr:innexin inx7 [Diachasma alloeum]